MALLQLIYSRTGHGDMKAVIYITKNKVWAEGMEYDLGKQSLETVLGRLKKEIKVDEARIVLGNEMAYVTSVKAGDELLNKNNVLRLARSWMPFPIDSECFDWKEIELVPGEKWLQLIASERYFLEDLSVAVVKNGIKVELITTIGVLLAEKTKGREAPVVLKWAGKEKLFVVAINGLADLVTADISEDDLAVYTKQKWGLAVNPEVINYSEKDLNVAAMTFAEKTEGEDKLIINLPILRDVVTGEMEKTEEKKKTSLWLIYAVFIVLAVMATGLTAWKTGILGRFGPANKEPEITPMVTPSLSITPEPTEVDLSSYKVQVLNGSGMKGEAARIKIDLLEAGLKSVDVGNTTATREGQIKTKQDVPLVVKEKIELLMTKYELRQGGQLKNGEKYDIVVVIGK